MNQFYHQKNAFGAHEGRHDSVSFSEQRESVVCPKPRRVGVLANIPNRPFRWHMSHPVEVSDSKAGAELLDIILMKEGYGVEQSANQVASSPPFFCGSPPSRAANPLIQDARFGDEKYSPLSSFPVPPPSGLASPSSAALKAGCARMNLGLKPATVRVEGFDCLNRDRQNSSIPAVA
ncbi:Translocase subunit seca [Melia azedarach]|uniref:Translocase subunit seca n=2 Tax=Melia azedarach TaxID=155640 RepID=A0ACC1X7L7_MELAZ|nr:Translocase subunit seca [Melia azedarach]KAJ4707098.1 Translocase subunit seca [Melia azedarach]